VIAPVPFTVEATAFRPPKRKGKSLGNIDLLVQPFGLELLGAQLRQTDRGLLLMFPKAALLLDDDTVMRGSDGKLCTKRFVNFDNFAALARFSALAIEAVERAFPGQLQRPPRAARHYADAAD